MTAIFSAIAAFWRSLFGKTEEEEETTEVRSDPDVDDVAQEFYENLLDADKKRKRKK